VRRTSLLAAGAALSLSLTFMAGCTKDETTNTGPAATSAPASSTTTAAATVSKDKVIEEGDKICKASDDKKSAPKSKSKADIEKFMKDGAATAREDIKNIKAIGTPDKDADKLTEALAKYTALVDLIEKRAADIGEDPSIIETDKELVAAQKDASSAAQAFGFKVCGADSSSSSSSTTTTEKSSASTTTTEKSGTSSSITTAKQYLSGLSKTITFTDTQIECVATTVFDDKALATIALSKDTTVDERKQLFSALVDCVGPEFLIDAFMKGIESKNPTAEQSACIRTDLEGMSKTDGVALVAGDADAVKAFADKIKADCNL
jgi:hypothetical protein